MLTIKSSPFARAFATAALIGSFAIAAPSHAAPNSTNQSSAAASQAMPVAATSSAKKGQRHSTEDMKQNVENRIKTLHDKLAITPEQESSWNEFAEAMRNNENSMANAIEDRRKNSEAMNAVEDLSSYQKIAQAHADGLQKVVSSFEPVYESLSADQKSKADDVFGRFEGRRGLAKAAAAAKDSMKSGSSAGTESTSSEGNE